MDWLRSLAALVIRLLLRLRYDIRVEGDVSLAERRGVLVLPNHPGEIDPVIVAATLWPRLAPHPVVVETFYYMTGLRWLMRWIGAIPMPQMEGQIGSYKRLRVQQALDGARARLARGENVMMYPSGRLMRSGLEDLRAVSGVTDLLAGMERKRVVLVRTTGLVGSSFSWVARRQLPDIWACFRDAAYYLCLNLIFFMPRRRVTVTIADSPEGFPYEGSKAEVNAFLEQWFNAGGEEPVSRVSYTFWKETLLQPPADREASDRAAADEVEVPPEAADKVRGKLAELSGKGADALQGQWQLSRELGLDSLAIAEVSAWLSEEFGVLDLDPEDLRTVQDVLAASAGTPQGGVGAAPPAPKGWDETRPRPQLTSPNLNRSVHRNFLEACAGRESAVAVADGNGVVTCGRARLTVVALAEQFRRLPGERVGVMLPASSGAGMATMALLLANKVPVMINWTVGDANLQHVLQVAGVERIITAGAFLDRLQTLRFELIADKVLPLEELGREIGPWQLMVAWRRGLMGAAGLCRLFGSDQRGPEDTAVVLFTSGSESAPKGVPLSHRNVQANVAGALEAVKLAASDVLLGFLPPFHSFGFTVTTLLPLLSGLKAAYYPNPTDSRKLVGEIARWRPTLLCGTPTFISGIFRTGRAEQLSSLQLLLAGAEKAPAALFEQARALCGAELLEGYGITECAPVLTLNRVGEEPRGVGRPLGDVEIRIVTPETREPVATGTQGLILVRGTNVFSGYLGRDSSDVFVDLDGDRFYVTGDLGYLDAAGNLILTGRMKRFVKVGGEMLSLPAMEEAIGQAFPGEDGEIASALAYVEPSGERPVICLFTMLEVTRDEVNEALRAAGFGNLARVQMVQRLPEIPLLGTGKTDYRRLTRLLEAELGA